MWKTGNGDARITRSAAPFELYAATIIRVLIKITGRHVDASYGAFVARTPFVYIINAEAFHTDNSTEDLNAHYIETG